MTSSKSEILELSVTRHIAAPSDKVWQVMTERMTEWWCPRPWRIEIIEQEWRAGGRNAMKMCGPEGEEFPEEGVFLEVTPGKRFVTTDAMTSEFRPTGPFMIGIWEVEEERGGTRYTATARHWSQETHDQHKEMGFEAGWKICAEQLAEICES